MNILLLGGTGFLGRYLAQQLVEEQYPVTVLTRNEEKLKKISARIPFVLGDLLHYEDIDFSIYTHIINCSGELNNEVLMQKLHVECLEGILNKIKNYPHIHWIQISSVGVYGKVSSGIVNEAWAFAPIGPYEVTKAQGEHLVKELCVQHHIKYTIIRPSNVFGINMPNQSLAQLISMMKRKLFCYIGMKKQEIVMNYVPVEDVVQLIILCLHHEGAMNEDFIISDQIALTEFVNQVCQEIKITNQFIKLPESLVRVIAHCLSFHPRSPLTQSRIDALTVRATYSCEKSAQQLNFIPHMGLKKGLKNYLTSA